MRPCRFGVGVLLLLALLALAVPSAAEDSSSVIERFTKGFVNAKPDAVMTTIHREFRTGEMDYSAFKNWLEAWFDWCDDYEFTAIELNESTAGGRVVVTGEFSRKWLLGIEASDADIQGEEEHEIFGSLEEEGGTVQNISRTERITFTLADGLIVGIEGMTLGDPKGSAMGMRDPRVRKLGTFFSGLNQIPIIGGLFSSSETTFSGSVKMIVTLLVTAGIIIGAWILLGTLLTNLRLSTAMSRHAFAEGVSYGGQHQAYTTHREQLAAGEKECRRHDFYLRDLIDRERFDDARDYVRGMIAYCAKQRDRDGEETYTKYLKRVDELERDAKFAEEHNLAHPEHSDIQ